MGISVAIIGRSELMYNTMLLLQQNGIIIKYIITAKEAPEYKYKSVDFEKFAMDNNIGFLHTAKLSLKDVLSLEKKWGKTDVGISVNYSGVISKEIIETYALGILNAHGGDLPRYRGNACMAWAIINEESRVGLCIHKMIGGELDSGPIIRREYKAINIDTHVGDLFTWMDKRIPTLFLDSVIELKTNPNYFIELQSLNSKDALRCYPRNSTDGKIDWSKSNEDILRLINASSEPFSGAFTFVNKIKIIIWRAVLYQDDENYLAVPGQVCRVDKTNGFVTAICGNGKLKICDIEVEGKRMLPANYIKSIRHRLV